MLMLDRAEVRSLLAWPELMDATQQSLIALADGAALSNTSSQLVVPGSALHLKAGALADPPIISVKANLRPDSGSTSGAILVFDHESQRLKAVISSADLTAMRTAAIAAVAARAILGEEPVRVALVGAGPVAKRVDDALEYLGLAAEVRIWSRSRERADDLAARAGSSADHLALDDMPEALDGADLVISCTPSRSPLIFPEYLSAGAVILAMGADSVGKRELGPGVLEAAEIYADVPQDALLVGESAYLEPDDAARVLSIGSFLSTGVRRGESRIVVDSVGSSAVDAAVVGLVMAAAERQGLGRRIDLDGSAKA